MIDQFKRKIEYVRISLTDRCNLRCRYCMPDGVPKLAHEDILTYEEFLRLAALFAQCGIDTVRITGGEPLVRRGVEQLTAGLKAIPGIRRVALTTNGVLLAQKLPALLAAGLDSVNISLDTLHPETFRRITGKDELAAVQNGIRAALASGIPVKLNCVPQPGVNEGELESLAAFAQEHPLQVRFIEMMPIGFGAGLPGLSGPELLERFYRRWPQLQPVTDGLLAELDTMKLQKDRNLGLVDAHVDASLPTGIALNIDAGAISGGGAIHHDPASGDYYGAVVLRIAKRVTPHTLRHSTVLLHGINTPLHAAFIEVEGRCHIFFFRSIDIRQSLYGSSKCVPALLAE